MTDLTDERLPEWNDLPEATRTALCDEGEFWEHANGGDAAHAIYRKIRELLAHRTNGGEAVAWQRRLMNTKDAKNGVPAGEWHPWKECTRDQAAEAVQTGKVEGFPELRSEARPLYASPVTTPQDGTSGVRVERVECVSYDTGFEQPTDPIWRIVLDGYCADFPSEGAALNFARAIERRTAHHREMLAVLKRAIAVWDAEVFDEAAADAVLKSAIETVTKLEPSP